MERSDIGFFRSYSWKSLITRYLEIEVTLDPNMWTILLLGYDRFLGKEHNIIISILCFCFEFTINPYQVKESNY